MQVERVLAKISEVTTAMIVVMMVLEGCVVFLAAAAYVGWLIQQVGMQQSLFGSAYRCFTCYILQKSPESAVQVVGTASCSCSAAYVKCSS